MSRRGIGVLAAILSVVAMALGGAAPASAAPYCGIVWGSLEKSAGSLQTAPLTNVRSGRHTCYDRVVFDFGAPADGYVVRYSPVVPAEGSGDPLAVAGGAKLWVTLLAPAYDQNGNGTYPRVTGDHVVNAAGYSTLRDVVYGGTFEGYTTFGVGVRARLPYRVFVLPGPNAGSRIVLDVAHRW